MSKVKITVKFDGDFDEFTMGLVSGALQATIPAAVAEPHVGDAGLGEIKRIDSEWVS